MNPATVYLSRLKKLVTSKEIFESATILLMTEERTKVEKISRHNDKIPTTHLSQAGNGVRKFFTF